MMDSADHNDSKSVRKWAGFFSLAQGLLLFIPLIVLGQAIDWPASLDDPASVALPRLLENESAVRLGYTAYLIYSILFAIAIYMIARMSKGRVVAALMTVIVGFAIASAVFRSIGIIRWLVPMPELATTWQSATTDQERYAISTTFELLNSYGGTMGEVLGVSIFASITILILCIASMKDRSMPTWLGVFGIFSAISLLATASVVLGIEPGELAIFLGTTMVQLWFLAIGLWLLLTGRRSR